MSKYNRKYIILPYKMQRQNDNFGPYQIIVTYNIKAKLVPVSEHRAIMMCGNAGGFTCF